MNPIEAYLDEKRIVTFRGMPASVITIQDYEKCLRAFERWLGRPIIEATREEILKYLHPRRGDWPRLRAFFRWAEEQEYIAKAPLKGIRIRQNIPTPRRDGYKTHPHHEIVKLIGGCIHWRDKIAISLYGFLGLRAQEVIPLNRNAISEKFETIKIVGKGNKPATISLDPISRELLQIYFKTVLQDLPGADNGTSDLPLLPVVKPHPIGRIIGNPRAPIPESEHYYFDKRVSYIGLVHSLERVYERVGLFMVKWSKFHRLRHSAITNAIQSGMSPIAVSKRLARHTQLSMTLDIYCHPDEKWIEEEWQKAIKKMPKPKDFE